MIRQFIKAWERVREVSSSGGKIFIRGAGSNGRMLLGDLAALGVKVTAFIDGNPALAGGEIKSVPIISPDEAYALAAGSFFILSSVNSGDIYAELRREMEDMGLAEGRDFADFGIDCDSRMLSDGVDFRDVPPRFLDRHEVNVQKFLGKWGAVSDTTPEIPVGTLIGGLNFIITTHCSLRCAHCAHLMPLCENPRHFDPAAIITDLDRLLSVCKVGCLQIMGGEPFLHPGLADMLSLLERMPHRSDISCVEFVTNGAVRPSQAVLNMLSRVENLSVLISNYGASSPFCEELSDWCVQHDVSVHTFKSSDKWCDYGDFRVKRNRSEDEMRHIFSVCGDSTCYQLYDGRLYHCGKLPMFYEERLIPSDRGAFVDIRAASLNGLAEAVSRYIYDTPFLSACDYCDGHYPGAKEVSRGVQIKKQYKEGISV